MKSPFVSPGSSVNLNDTTPASSPAGFVQAKAPRSKAGAMLRRFSDLDLSAFKKFVDRRSVQSLPADMGRGLSVPGESPRVDAEMQAMLHKVVAHVHQGVKTVAAEDPSMAPGLAVIGKLTRADEVASFRRLFITQPGVAIGKIIYNVSDLNLSHNITSLISNRFLTPAARGVLFDTLMTEPITANLIKLVSTKRGFLRIGLKLRRAMLFKVTAQGRPPQHASTLSAAETLQASGLLFKKEGITAAQITMDTILMGIGNDVPELIATLVQELFVDDKQRVRGFAGALAVDTATKLHTFMRDRFPGNDWDLSAHKKSSVKVFQNAADMLWSSSFLEALLTKYVGEDKAGSFLQRLEREGERLGQLAARLAASRS